MGEKREVAGRKNYVKYADCTKGDVLVDGTFLRKVMGKYGYEYEFECGETGNIICLGHAGHLKWKMESGDVREGEKIEVVYDGKSVIESGQWKGTESHQFKVFREVPEGGDATPRPPLDDPDDLDGFEEDTADVPPGTDVDDLDF